MKANFPIDFFFVSVTLAVCIIVVRSTQIEMEEQLKPRVYEMQNLYIRQPAPIVV